MSKYRVLKTTFQNREVLLNVLSTLYHGYIKEGFRVNWSSQIADIVVSHHGIGCRYDDLAFVKQPDGSFTAMVSDHDPVDAAKAQDALNKVSMAYARRMTYMQAEALGYQVYEEVNTEGEIVLTLSRAY